MDFIDKMAVSHRKEITETGKDIQEWLEVRAKQAVWIPVKLSSSFINFWTWCRFGWCPCCTILNMVACAWENIWLRLVSMICPLVKLNTTFLSQNVTETVLIKSHLSFPYWADSHAGVCVAKLLLLKQLQHFTGLNCKTDISLLLPLSFILVILQYCIPKLLRCCPESLQYIVDHLQETNGTWVGWMLIQSGLCDCFMEHNKTHLVLSALNLLAEVVVCSRETVHSRGNPESKANR